MPFSTYSGVRLIQTLGLNMCFSIGPSRLSLASPHFPLTELYVVDLATQVLPYITTTYQGGGAPINSYKWRTWDLADMHTAHRVSPEGLHTVLDAADESEGYMH